MIGTGGFVTTEPTVTWVLDFWLEIQWQFNQYIFGECIRGSCIFSILLRCGEIFMYAIMYIV